jgi:GTP cyclohydrolase II
LHILGEVIAVSFQKPCFATQSPNVLSISATAKGALARLTPDPVCVSVERAVQELRQGRAVIVRGLSGALVVASAETLGGEEIANIATAFGEEVGLVLAEPRLRHMGLEAPGAMRLALSGLSAGEIERLFITAVPAVPATPRRPASALESAALDLVRTAYLVPAAVVMPATVAVENMVIVEATMIDLYPDRSVRDLRIVARAPVPLSDAPVTEFVMFSSANSSRDQLAIVVGTPDPAQPVLTRLHSACLTGDLFGSLKCDCGDQLRLAVQAINAAGSGLLLYLDQEGRGIGLRNKMRAYGLQAQGHDTLDADAILGYGPDERRYGIAGRMLDLLGFRRIVMLTNNPDKIRAIEQTGVTVEGHRRLLGAVNSHNAVYLSTKATRAGHLLDKAPKPIVANQVKTHPSKSPQRPPQEV